MKIPEKVAATIALWFNTFCTGVVMVQVDKYTKNADLSLALGGAWWIFILFIYLGYWELLEINIQKVKEEEE